MGLTIHYHVTFKGNKFRLRQKLEELRQKCLDLPFQEVGEVETCNVTQEGWDTFYRLQEWCSYPKNTQENLAHRDQVLKDRFGLSTWDFIEADSYFQRGKLVNCIGKPTTKVSLFLWPDEGCESADLNFFRRGSVYKCDSFCKTQYAEHFARSHLLVIAVLDMLKNSGFIVDVNDEGEYWETRDLEVLAKNINESTAMIKAILGSLTNALDDSGKGMTLEAPIETSENYMKVNKKDDD